MSLRITRTILWLWIIFFAQQIGYGQTKAKPHLYSNVVYNEEGGDLLGYELEYELHGSRVQGDLRIYEGGCGSPTPVSGTLVAGKLSLHGENQFYGRIKVEGNLSGNVIKATLHMEKATAAETLKLKKIQKPHC